MSGDFILAELDEDDEFVTEQQEPISIECELEKFREQWQRELRGAEVREPSAAAAPSLEEEAKFLFLQGVNSEQGGKLANAIQYYRRALQLVPDIESRIEDFQPRPNNARERTESESSNLSAFSDTGDEDPDDLDDLVAHFTRLRLNNKTRCTPEHEQRGAHISVLPVEVLMYIIKWVVSLDLDINSLENMAMVCREWFVCCRDEDLWRLVCRRVWGRHVGSTAPYRGNHRRMFIQRPHMRHNGVYIGRCHYYRAGEKSLDNYYKPFHFVEYFRYVRFFPDGQVLLYCTPDAPAQTVGRLKLRSAHMEGLMHGYYRMAADTVTCIVKRRRVDYEPNTYHKYRRLRNNNNNAAAERDEQTFHAVFCVGAAGKRARAQLVWTAYSLHTTNSVSGEETVTDFELSPQSHGPMVFSRVRSFTAEADRPLS